MDPVDAYREPSRGVRLGVGAAIVVVIAVAVVTIGFAVWRGATAPVEIVSEEDGGVVAESAADDDPVSVEAGELYVHVFGAVSDPGLYVLPAGSRVVDAIAAAGGLADDAAAQGVNLARPLSDGEQLGVPTTDEYEGGVVPDDTGSAGNGGGGVGPSPVNLNTADQSELETLPGVGPALAQRIIGWREENGGFSAADDLLAVSGIGPKVFDGLRDLVTV